MNTKRWPTAAEKAKERQEKIQIWEDFKSRVKDRGMEALPAIVEHYGHTTLKKVSPGVFTTCCPFHVEKTPSFQVSGKGYICRGAGCGVKGDVFKFIQDKLGVSFKDALMEVASYVGIIPPEDNAPRVPYRPAAPKPPADPAAAFLADPSRLGPHDLNTVPPGLFRARPRQQISLYREGKEDESGEKQPSFVKTYRPEMVHEYKDTNGELKLVILRVVFPDRANPGKKKKIFLPLRAEPPIEGTPEALVAGGMSWHVRNTGENRRPVYGAHDLKAWIADPNRGPILLVEGEKCADYANRVFPEPGTLVLSASGGFNANILADWKELTDLMAESEVFPKRMVVWPDAEPNREFTDGRPSLNTQEFYAKQIFSGFLRDLWASTQNSSVSEDIEFTRVIPPEGVEKGWDLADAVDEGWTRAKLEAYISAAVPVDLSHMDGHAPKAAENDAEASSELPSLGD